jgi:S-DNA-T family DNA segregation ATPase FtsK/SpoIIIE
VVLVAAWFTATGALGDIIRNQMTGLFGAGVLLLPIVLFYWGIIIFKRPDNRIPLVIGIASILMLVWWIGFFNEFSAGGEVGEKIGGILIANVGVFLAGLIFLTLIAITSFFMFSISPAKVAKTLASNLRTDKFTEKQIKPKSTKEVKINKNEIKEMIPDEEKPIVKKHGLFGSKTAELKSEKPTETPKTALVSIGDPTWKMPSLDLLEKKQTSADAGDIEQNIEIIKNTLADFKIDIDMESVNVGPRVTQYALRPPSGVKLTKISSLESNLALNLGAKSLRIEAPIPGQKAVGIEVPNVKSAEVRLYGILKSKSWRTATANLTFAVGNDIAGDAIVSNLGKMPHLLIAGQTGSGKSVMINSLITSLLYRNAPSDMKLILVDPKQVEMTPYEGIPHLLTPIITDPNKTISALKWAVNEMERRYTLLAEEKLRDIQSYNAKKAAKTTKIPIKNEDDEQSDTADQKMPFIVIVIDELADLMMVAAKDVEALIVRLAQKARAVGIHLVLATQRPSVNVITGLIKANIPARIAFTVASQVDSRTILDQVGAEKLLGSGDMLLLTPDMSKPKRIQGAWVTDEEITKVTNDIRSKSIPQYDDGVISQSIGTSGRGGITIEAAGDTDDEFMTAVQVVIDAKKASTSLLQRKMRIGYGKAARIMEEMEERSIIGQQDGSKPREVLVHSIEEASSL